MYERYGQKIGWSVKPVSASESDMGGFKELVISVKGDSVYSQLKFEAGVHRVQRVPATESQGRVDRFMKKYGMGSANSATSKEKKEEKDSKK